MTNHNIPANLDQAVIRRSPKDKENPYSQISNSLIRDGSISPDCRWLLIYLLSNKEGWHIKASQLISHVQPHMGRNRLYEVLEEAIQAGYMERTDIVKGNLKCGVSYQISESPIFKECFRRSSFRDTESRHTENQEANKKTIDKKEHEERKEVAHPADGLAILFFEKLKAINEKLKEPNFKVWAKEFRLMMERDKLSEADIRKVMDYVVSTADKPSSNGFCWANVVLSPSSLRKQFAKLWGETKTTSPTVSNDKENAKLANDVALRFGKRGDISTGYNYIEFLNGQRCVVIKFDEKKFREMLTKELNIRKLSLGDL